MAEGPLSKSDSKQRRIDVAAVGNRKSPFAATLAGEPRTEVRPLEPEEQLPLFAIFRLSRTGRLARFARPQAYELPVPDMLASLRHGLSIPRGTAGIALVGQVEAVAALLAAGLVPTSAPAALLY